RHRQKSTTEIVDNEFGAISVRRAATRYLRLKVEPDGRVAATIPYYATLISLRALVDKNRRYLRKSIAKLPPFRVYSDDEIKRIRKKAREFLTRRLEFLAAQHDFNYNRLFLRNQKTRWGSCSPDRNISLNIALVLLPPHLIDYVILHELTHLHEMNHSPRFWTKLIEICPNARAQRRELKKYSPYLK
ncbi:MAG: M48 family metallopeptidase, partial [Candidatus Nomurabacteria bacterium]|nr:M48 family metallopeptidase [Candidatus Nomurabacteria bacterium]